MKKTIFYYAAILLFLCASQIHAMNNNSHGPFGDITGLHTKEEEEEEHYKRLRERILNGLLQEQPMPVPVVEKSQGHTEASFQNPFGKDHDPILAQLESPQDPETSPPKNLKRKRKEKDPTHSHYEHPKKRQKISNKPESESFEEMLKEAEREKEEKNKIVNEKHAELCDYIWNIALIQRQFSTDYEGRLNDAEYREVVMPSVNFLTKENVIKRFLPNLTEREFDSIPTNYPVNLKTLPDLDKTLKTLRDKYDTIENLRNDRLHLIYLKDIVPILECEGTPNPEFPGHKNKFQSSIQSNGQEMQLKF